MKHILVTILLASTAGCAARASRPVGQPPADPLAGEDHETLFRSARVWAARGDLVRAEQYFQAAMARGHAEAAVMGPLLEVCVAASRLRAALAYAEPYLERNPGDAGIRYVVAHLHLGLGDRVRARRELERVAIEDAGLAAAQLALARLSYVDGDHAAARARLLAYLELAPTDKRAREARALLAEIAAAEEREGAAVLMQEEKQ